MVIRPGSLIAAALGALLALAAAPVPQAPPAPAYVTVGIFLGQIEEGARIFTPTRLLPPGYPESVGHEFPTAPELHADEVALLIRLGEAVGLKLAATLERYPRRPVSEWRYPRLHPPPVDELPSAALVERPPGEAPLPGLRAVAFSSRGFPLAFLVDTRGLSLADRHMERATAMGLDVTRRELVEALERVEPLRAAGRITIVTFRRPPGDRLTAPGGDR